MKRTYVLRGRKLVEKPKRRYEAKAPMVIGDIQPYFCHQTGSYISSRSEHRQMLREHGMIEVGNEWDAFSDQPHLRDFEPTDESSDAPQWAIDEISEGLK